MESRHLINQDRNQTIKSLHAEGTSVILLLIFFFFWMEDNIDFGALCLLLLVYRTTWVVLYVSIWQQRRIKIHGVVLVEMSQIERRGIGEEANLLRMVRVTNNVCRAGWLVMDPLKE